MTTVNDARLASGLDAISNIQNVVTVDKSINSLLKDVIKANPELCNDVIEPVDRIDDLIKRNIELCHDIIDPAVDKIDKLNEARMNEAIEIYRLIEKAKALGLI